MVVQGLTRPPRGRAIFGSGMGGEADKLGNGLNIVAGRRTPSRVRANSMEGDDNSLLLAMGKDSS